MGAEKFEEGLLEALESDGRAKMADLASMLGAKEKDVESKIGELRKRGAIKRFKAVVDWEKAGKELVFALIEVKITPQRGHGYDAIAERITNFSEVRTAYLVSGGYDVLVIVQGKTLKEVSNFVSEKLAPIEGVQSTNTHFLLKRYKEEGESFFDKREGERLAVTA